MLLYLLYRLIDYSLMLLLPLRLPLSPLPSFHQLFLSLLLPRSSPSPPEPHLFSLLPLQFILPCFCCITFHNLKTFSRFSYSELLRKTYSMFPRSLRLLIFIYLVGDLSLFSSPHTGTCIYKSLLGKALVQPRPCVAEQL